GEGIMGQRWSAYPPASSPTMTINIDGGTTTNGICTIEGTDSLTTPNWSPICKLATVNSYGSPSVWVLSTNDVLLGISSVITNKTNPQQLEATTPFNVPYPASDKLFFRVKL